MTSQPVGGPRLPPTDRESVKELFSGIDLRIPRQSMDTADLRRGSPKREMSTGIGAGGEHPNSPRIVPIPSGGASTDSVRGALPTENGDSIWSGASPLESQRSRPVPSPRHPPLPGVPPPERIRRRRGRHDSADVEKRASDS